MSKKFDPNNTDMIEVDTKVPEGIYVCLQCSKCLITDDDNVILPYCSECNGMYWMKI